MAVYLSSILTDRLPVSVIVQVASSASDEYRWEYPEEETSILHYGHEVEKQFSDGAFKAVGDFLENRETSHSVGFYFA